ncbi:type II toxin-antitoxin system HicB family antitoxin [Kosakonia quasisacchari]|uniref:Type II toxin-antitoxin system HicB family antitoxin n=1 Tax=Kosakonia quasisacchari TaxID=2529380 RepID=A0A4R0GLD1_9ENTR|nr:type II toxin-antitoxin system HicB family antitoxin [Kosakonia quasisacchari]TCB98136.1 type II toxin-antitoxin system HicB family antitoxin [Kosakonia quasisacchari]
MSNMLKYKGYFGSVEFSLEDKVLHGKIQCVNDLITYEAETLDGLQLAFEEAVDDYLETCMALKKEPEKPMSGTFNVRIGSELHKKAYLAACAHGKSLNDYVKTAIEEKVVDKKEFHFHFEKRERTEVFSHEYFTPSEREPKWRGNVEKGTRH